MIIKWIDTVGNAALALSEGLGNMATFLAKSIITFFTTRLKLHLTFEHMLNIGVNSSSVIFLTGSAVGSVLAYQSYIGLHRFRGEQFIGPVLFLAMVREFGPVLTGLMVTGRAGSAITAEIGTMRISEQIDALQTVCINVQQYLIVPRIVATTFIVPFLSLFGSLCGIVAGYVISVHMLGVNAEMFMRTIRENAELFDITSGLYKAIVFGWLLSWIACYKGYTTEGGARGVGIATTQSVVYACVAIFLADYILTAFMF